METAVVITRLTPAQGRRFGYTVGTAFVVLGGLLWWRERITPAITMGVIGGSLIAAALVAPGALGPVYRAWMGLAKVISRVTTPLFLGAVYFLLITPVGLVLRMIGRDPLAPQAGSRWRARSTRRSDIQRQF